MDFIDLVTAAGAVAVLVLALICPLPVNRDGNDRASKDR